MPAPQNPALRRTLGRDTSGLILVFCFAVLSVTIVFYSRLTLLIMPPTASLGLLIFTCGTAVACTLLSEGIRFGAPFIYITELLIMSIVSAFLFQIQFGFENDFRVAFSVSGIISYFLILFSCRKIGYHNTLFMVIIVLSIYVFVYDLISFMVVFMKGFLDAPSRSLILNDPFRGRRVYFLASTGALLLFGSLIDWRPRLTPVVVLPVLAAAAFLISQSRVPIAIMILLLSLRWLRADRLLAAGLLLVPVTIVVTGLSVPVVAPQISQLLSKGDWPTMDLRIETLTVAGHLFSEYPILGTGTAADFSNLRSILNADLYPEDLGVVGLMSSGGVVWLLIFTVSVATCVAIARSFLLSGRAGDRELGYAAAFLALFSMTTTVILTGDGAMILGILWALSTARQGEGAGRAHEVSVRG